MPDRDRPNRQLSLPKLGLAVLLMLSIISWAIRLPPGPGLLVLLGGMALLGVSAWFFGYDSRDKQDWE